ncbi:MAG: TLD domain-containing protein, partial [Deltaproteobacteria bacterium]|nr:TLD domain-containing protein [Deltaproteobacteria bacterium]
NDPQNCGGCAYACPQNQVCAKGQCSLLCVGGTTKCGSTCVDTNLDPANCGGCNKPCPQGQVCANGACALQCVGGTTLCSNKCVDTSLDPANCGSCNKACAGGESCKSGACVSPTKFPGSVLISASEGDQINAWIGSPSQAWTLCYRRSTHGASAATFHNNCNNKGVSVSVAQLNSGRKIGGYASAAWTTANNYKGDTSSFLFSLTYGYKHACGGSGSGCSCGACPYYMYDYVTYGPTFGGGHDWNVANDMTTGYCNIGHTYNCRTGSYGTAQCRDDFCGSYSSWNVTELEVWVK